MCSFFIYLNLLQHNFMSSAVPNIHASRLMRPAFRRGGAKRSLVLGYQPRTFFFDKNVTFYSWIDFYHFLTHFYISERNIGLFGINFNEIVSPNWIYLSKNEIKLKIQIYVFYSETIKNLFRGERKTATVVPRSSQPRERRGIKGYSRLARNAGSNCFRTL